MELPTRREHPFPVPGSAAGNPCDETGAGSRVIVFSPGAAGELPSLTRVFEEHPEDGFHGDESIVETTLGDAPIQQESDPGLVLSFVGTLFQNDDQHEEWQFLLLLNCSTEKKIARGQLTTTNYGAKAQFVSMQI